MNDLIPFERTIEQFNNRNNAPSPKTITATNNEENFKLIRAAARLSVLSVNNLKIHKTKPVKNICLQEKCIV